MCIRDRGGTHGVRPGAARRCCPAVVRPTAAHGRSATAPAPHLGASPAGRLHHAVSASLRRSCRADPLSRVLLPGEPALVARTAGTREPAVPQRDGPRPSTRDCVPPAFAGAPALAGGAHPALRIRGQLRLCLLYTSPSPRDS